MPMAWQLEQTCWTVSRPGPAGRPTLAGVTVAGGIGGVDAGGPAGEAGGGAGRWMTTGVVAAGAGTVDAEGAAGAVATMDSAGEAAGVGAAGIGVCAGAGADVPAGEQAVVISTAP
jgi:hypothetical protein